MRGSLVVASRSHVCSALAFSAAERPGLLPIDLHAARTSFALDWLPGARAGGRPFDLVLGKLSEGVEEVVLDLPLDALGVGVVDDFPLPELVPLSGCGVPVGVPVLGAPERDAVEVGVAAPPHPSSGAPTQQLATASAIALPSMCTPVICVCSLLRVLFS